MKFVYVLTGWEGSVADSRVLRDAINRVNGLKVPKGNYYLCDNGYSNCMEPLGNAVKQEGERGKTTRGRRLWSKVEEDALIKCLFDIINDGWKAENGFKVGFQRELKKGMHKLLPGTDIVANPHINSKIHVWKEYSTLSDLFSKSGIGWNSTTSMIEVDDEWVWDASRRWLEIFGKVGVTSENMVDPINLVNDLVRDGQEPEGETGDGYIPFPLKARDDEEDTSVCLPTKSGISSNSGQVNENKQLNDIMSRIVGLKVPDKLKVCDELVQNAKRHEFFFSLPEDEQEEYVWILLNGRL
ncbi:hypothetical protein ACS0TY_034975 [Phlomoides rotata]